MTVNGCLMSHSHQQYGSPYIPIFFFLFLVRSPSRVGGGISAWPVLVWGPPYVLCSRSGARGMSADYEQVRDWMEDEGTVVGRRGLWNTTVK